MKDVKVGRVGHVTFTHSLGRVQQLRGRHSRWVYALNGRISETTFPRRSDAVDALAEAYWYSRRTAYPAR